MDAPARGALRDAAMARGLNVLWAIPRKVVLDALPPEGFMPARDSLNPGGGLPEAWETVLLLGNAGPAYWEMFRAGPHTAASEPLDAHTAAVVEELLALLRADDPGAEVRFPFRHRWQIYNFQGLAGLVLREDPAPCGVSVHPEHGPWFAWRAALFTQRVWPPTEPLTSPCGACAQAHGTPPCQRACPVEAASPAGFRWRVCAEERLRPGGGCAQTCPARLACPVGRPMRYPPDALRHHYQASLRMLRGFMPGG